MVVLQAPGGFKNAAVAEKAAERRAVAGQVLSKKLAAMVPTVEWRQPAGTYLPKDCLDNATARAVDR